MVSYGAKVSLKIDGVDKEVVLSFDYDNAAKMEYYNIREFCYRNIRNGAVNFDGSEDGFDKISHLLLVSIDDRIIGGARITISKPSNRILLPMEDEEFRLNQIFPLINLDNETYCEYSRLAILPKYRGNHILRHILNSLNQKALEDKCRYLFSVAPLVQARLYKNVMESFGYPFIIHPHIIIPKDPIMHGNLTMVVSVMRFSKSPELVATRTTRFS